MDGKLKAIHGASATAPALLSSCILVVVDSGNPLVPRGYAGMTILEGMMMKPGKVELTNDGSVAP